MVRWPGCHHYTRKLGNLESQTALYQQLGIEIFEGDQEGIKDRDPTLIRCNDSSPGRKSYVRDVEPTRRH
jgi:hypothetical protein